MYYQPLNPLKAERRDLFFHGNILGAALLAGIFVSTAVSLVYMIMICLFSGVSLQSAIETLTSDAVILYSLNTLSCFLMFVLLFSAAAKILHKNIGDSCGFALPQNGRAVLICLGFTLFMTVIGDLATNFLSFFSSSAFSVEPYQPDFGDSSGSILSIVFCMINLAVAPALVEEFAFRGIILGSLRKFGDWPAIIVSTILFAAVHGNFVQIPYTLCFGFALGIMRVLTGSIWPCVLMHFINNFIAGICDYLPDVLVSAVNILYLFASLIIGIVALVYIIKYKAFSKIGDVPSTMGKASRTLRIIFSPVMIIALIYYLIEAFSSFQSV